MTSTPTDSGVEKDPVTVLVAGASGNLGQRIIRELLAVGARPRAMVRGGSEHPAAADIRALGDVEMVDGSFGDAPSLDRATDGADIVVSSLQGGPDIIVDGQEALAQAAQRSGVRRIFPSDFGLDSDRIRPEDHLFFQWRGQAQAAIAATGLPQTNTYNGAFMEMLLPQEMFVLLDWDTGEVRHWGNADQPYDFTTMDDTARFVAAACVDPDVADGPLRIAGDTVSPAQLSEVATRVYARGFTHRSLGSLDELDAEIERQQAAAPDNPMVWAGLLYLRAMASGAGKLRSLDNDRYPGVAPTDAAHFFESLPDQSTR